VAGLAELAMRRQADLAIQQQARQWKGKAGKRAGRQAGRTP